MLRRSTAIERSAVSGMLPTGKASSRKNTTRGF
jgi:hypothetical protein